MKIKNIIGHLRTITHHKNQVMKNCFKVGLYKQGLLHDLSKYSPVEFIVGCKYYQGYRSPMYLDIQLPGCIIRAGISIIMSIG